jgi:broad specificity phosphatase PhoE
MPKNANILMVRHAEKPDSGKELSVTGQERAHAYAVYFQNYVLNGTVLNLNYIVATADSSQSHRPRLTVEPLAKAMGMDIDDRYQENDYRKVADDILQNSNTTTAIS